MSFSIEVEQLFLKYNIKKYKGQCKNKEIR